MRYGRIDIHCFMSNIPALFITAVIQRTHIMQSVCKLNYYYPYILAHGKEYFTDIFSLLLVFCKCLDFFQLCNTVYEHRNVASELLLKHIQSTVGILHNVMQQCGAYSIRIHTQFDKDIRNSDRVSDIWLSRFSLLPLVILVCHLISGNYL